MIDIAFNGKTQFHLCICGYIGEMLELKLEEEF